MLPESYCLELVVLVEMNVGQVRGRELASRRGGGRKNSATGWQFGHLHHQRTIRLALIYAYSRWGTLNYR
jgi:hypothetical protein